jgi:hypothetical protein
MKRPLSVTIVTRDKHTQQEIHNRFDLVTRFPRLQLISIMIRALFSI